MANGDRGNLQDQTPACPKHDMPLVRVTLPAHPHPSRVSYFRCSRKGCVYTLLDSPKPPSLA